jgi:predicted DNA-binding transcriptional regulator AlpA
MDRLLDKMETATKLKVSIPTLDRLRRRADFPRAVRISRHRVAFPERELDAWLAEQRDHAAA